MNTKNMDTPLIFAAAHPQRDYHAIAWLFTFHAPGFIFNFLYTRYVA